MENCPHCGKIEIMEHLLFDCPNLRSFWTTIANSSLKSVKTKLQSLPIYSSLAI